MSILKPYLLVRVRMPDYQYIGETMGFPMPEGTIMVRRVPGHPGTLEELRVTQVEPIDGSHRQRWVHYARVAGAYSFPIDMLRRENASPVNFDPETGQRLKGVEPDEPLTIAKVTDRKIYDWNEARWSSFGWKCDPFHSERAP